MTEPNTYSGSCHCGRVRFEVTTPLSTVGDCNCSICTKAGLLLTIVGESDFRLMAGADALKEYWFNRKLITHLFCETCGVRPFLRGKHPDGTAKIAVNVRCLAGVDLASLNRKPIDGRSIPTVS